VIYAGEIESWSSPNRAALLVFQWKGKQPYYVISHAESKKFISKLLVQFDDEAFFGVG